jgi:hypothetical protein
MSYYDEPETSIPETTVPDTTVPDTTVPETTTTVAYCPPGEVRQNYGQDAPCGPTDPCVGIDPETGLGSTLWTFQTCGTPVATTTTTVAAAEPPPTLPATGGETGWIALTGTVMILTGISLVSMVKGWRS